MSKFSPTEVKNRMLHWYDLVSRALFILTAKQKKWMWNPRYKCVTANDDKCAKQAPVKYDNHPLMCTMKEQEDINNKRKCHHMVGCNMQEP